jgi:DNA-binding LacI/PurR family transcriptional regulator
MFMAVEHLVSHGHKRIAHLTRNDTSQFDFVQRRQEFAHAMRSFNLAKCAGKIVSDDGEMSDVARRIMEIKVTAVVCASDWLAQQLWTALEEAGLQVPTDISLIGVDDAPEAASRGLTSLGFSFAEVGRSAADALVAQLGGQDAAECSRIVPVHLRERDSVRKL